jgi:hypothetical protein
LRGISWFDFAHHDPEFVEGSDYKSQISDFTLGNRDITLSAAQLPAGSQ